MDAKTPRTDAGPVKDLSVAFNSPSTYLGDVEGDMIGVLVSSAADLALIVENGEVKDIAISDSGLAGEGFADRWRGMRWIDTVTVESRPKIEEMLNSDSAPRRWRQVNHPSDSALDVPVKYIAVRIGPENRFVVLGRDLRAMSILQQRLVEAHQDLERDYARLRYMEARYRMVFDASSDPLLILDLATMVIKSANPGAARLLSSSPRALEGKAIGDLVHSESALAALTGEVNATGSGRANRIQLATGETVDLEATAFREERAARLMVKLVSDPARADGLAGGTGFSELLEELPDGFAVVDADQRLISMNSAFRDLMKVAGRSAGVGADVGEFLGRSGTDLNVLFSTLKKNGVLRNFATVMRDRFGSEEPVEVSAVAMTVADKDVFGLSVRSIARRLSTGPDLSQQLPSHAGQFTELVGRVPLKDIVRESTLLIEKLCIEAALEITANNRASAAEMLGLSRQGLYSKLKRSGLNSNDT